MQPSSPYRLGILGGLGAVASAEFHRRFLLQWARSKAIADDKDYPDILHISTSLAGITPRGLEDELAARTALQDKLETFRSWGAQLVAVPCNSLQPVLASLADCSLRKVNPWDSAQPLLRSLQKQFIVLGSKSLRASLPTNSSTGFAALQQLGEPRERLVDAIIEKVLRGELSRAKLLWEHLLDELQWLFPPLDGLVIACSELSVVHHYSNTSPSFAVLDTLDCLVQETVAHLLSLELP